MEADLQAHFGNQCQPEALAEAASICRVYEISAEDLYYKWEAFLLGFPGHQLDFSVDNLRDFRKDIQASLKQPAAAVKQEPGLSSGLGTPAGTGGALRKQLGRGNIDNM